LTCHLDLRLYRRDLPSHQDSRRSLRNSLAALCLSWTECILVTLAFNRPEVHRARP
jgi:hypothetical protein